MIYEMLKISDIFNKLKESNAIITSYIIENSNEIDINKKRPTIVICPGGGYGFTSDREAEPVALKFLSKGFNVIIVRYSVAPTKYPAALLELASTISYIRSKENQWNVDKDKIIVCGFSAGGHLAGSMGVFWKEEFIKDRLNIENEKVKPNGLILCYPVITGGEFAHRGSFDNLLGKSEDHTKLSLENLVTEDTPKTFLWHTFNDGTVPVQNSLLFANALSEKRVPFEMHIYPNGVHGLSLCEESTARNREKKHIDEHVASWFNLACEWINRL